MEETTVSKSWGWAVAASPRRANGALLTALTLCFGALIVWAVNTPTTLDYAVYYLAAIALAHGVSPYGIGHAQWNQMAAQHGVVYYAFPYRYPPLTAMLLLPFISLGPTGAMIIWEVASAVAFVLGAVLVGRSIGGGFRTTAALAALLLCYPAYHTLQVGQVNGFLFLSLAAALWALVSERSWLVGLGLAIGTSLKLTPAALIAYLVWRRRWLLALCALGVLLAIATASLLLVGIHPYADYLHRAIGLTDPNSVRVSPGIDGFQAVLGRILMPWAASQPSTRTTIVVWAARALSVALVAASAALLSQRRRGSDATLALELSLVVAGTLLIAPFTYYHQYALLLIPLLVVGERLLKDGRRVAVGILIVLFLAVDLNQLLWVSGRSFVLAHGLWRFFSAPSVLALVLWLLAAQLLRSPAEARSALAIHDIRGRDAARPRQTR